jgi:hypothetical protein
VLTTAYQLLGSLDIVSSISVVSTLVSVTTHHGNTLQDLWGYTGIRRLYQELVNKGFHHPMLFHDCLIQS